MLKGVLLDIDGTLLLSNDAHAQAWVDTFRQFGYDDIPFDRVQPLIGMGGDKLLGTLIPGLSDAEGVGKQMAARRQEIFLDRYLGTLRPTPGARPLLLHLRDVGLKLTIATSAKNAELDGLLKAAQIDDLIHEQATSDDASQSKPDPDIVHAALEKSGLEPHDVVMLGDTPYDIESAGKAGVGVIAFRTGGHNADLHAALAVYDTPADLLTHFDESPIGKELATYAH